MTKWTPYLDIKIEVATSNPVLMAESVEDSRIANFIDAKLQELRREVSELFPSMDISYVAKIVEK